MPAAQQQLTKSALMEAPRNGIVIGESGIMGDPNAALDMYNLIPRELGVQLRPGSAEWAIGLADLAGSDSPEVRTVMSFLSESTGVADRVFACTDKGIYDISSGGAGPWTPVLAWPNPGNTAGWCSFINYTNVAGDHWLLVCDEDNGYYQYKGSTNTWVLATITGGVPDAEDLVYVTEWQNRLWFIERNTSIAWYLPLGQIDGTPTAIDLGSRFLRGGGLRQLTGWTLDDGAGMDDKFLALSGGGDVLAFSGIDPDNAANFLMQGRWFVGQPPAGRRAMSTWSGDVYILSSYGMVLASALVTGLLPDEQRVASYNITRLFNVQMKTHINDLGWGGEFFPQDNIAVFSVPNPVARSAGVAVQFVLNLSTRAWTTFRGLDMLSTHKTQNTFFYGTQDGRVFKMEGSLDNAPLSGSSAEPFGIYFGLMPHYTSLGVPETWKIVQFCRAYTVGGVEPGFEFVPKYDFDIELPASSEIPPDYFSTTFGWDEVLWDQALWAGGYNAYNQTLGGGGMGRYLTIAVSGQAYSRFSYVAFGLMVQMGGLL